MSSNSLVSELTNDLDTDVQFFNHFTHFSELKEFHNGENINYPDPVDPNRNVAAALSTQKYGEFLTTSRNFFKDIEDTMPTSFIIQQYFSLELGT